jgi:hypothetical protein
MRSSLGDVSLENVKRGPLVSLFDGGIQAPKWLEFTVVGAGPYNARFRTELRDGRYVIVRYCLEALPDGPPIEAGVARTMQINNMATYGNIALGPRPGAGPDESGAALRARGPHDPTVGAVVAITYQMAGFRGEPEAQAVAARLDCSMATASKFIAAAKDDGHLQISPIHKRGK